MKSKKAPEVKTVALGCGGGGGGGGGGQPLTRTRTRTPPPHTCEQVLAAIDEALRPPATDDGTPLESLIRQRVRRKAAGYRSQDEKMGRVADDNATPDEVLGLLRQSRLACSYCQRAVEMFGAPRSPDGWTLDRKENHVAHTLQNVVVCCLKCNLNKRRRDTEKYRFAKQLSSVRRLGHHDS